MKRFSIPNILFVLTALTSLCAGCATTGGNMADDERGFIKLFDGSSTQGWSVYRSDNEPVKEDAFVLNDGTLMCKGYGGCYYRYSAREFDDFILRLEFKMSKGSNSGICPRSPEGGDPPFVSFEVQLLDDCGKHPDRHTTGAIYDVVTPMYNASKPAGEWNEMEIACKGPLVKVIVNGFKLIDTDFSKLTEPRGKFDFAYVNLPKSGYIYLQDHGGVLWFRNIRIKPL